MKHHNIQNYYMGGLQYLLFRQLLLAKDPQERAIFHKALELANDAKQTYEEMLVECEARNISVDQLEDDFLASLGKLGGDAAEGDGS